MEVLLLNLFNYNLDPCEMLFVRYIQEGLELQNENLTEFDIEILTTSILTGLDSLDKRFEKYNIDKVDWNNRLVESLKIAIDNEINNIGKNKELSKKLKTKPLHETLDNCIRSMHSNSTLVLNGVVQNWYQKYWTIQARKSAVKTLSSGCLLPIILIFLIISIIFVFMK